MAVAIRQKNQEKNRIHSIKCWGQSQKQVDRKQQAVARGSAPLPAPIRHSGRGIFWKIPKWSGSVLQENSIQITDYRRAPRHFPPKKTVHPGSFPREAIRGLGYKKTGHRLHITESHLLVNNGVQPFAFFFCFRCKRTHSHTFHHPRLLYIFLACGSKNYGVVCKGYFFRVAKSDTDSRQPVLRTGPE